MSSWGKFSEDQPSNKYWSSEEAHEKLTTYCAYQERCPWDVRKKLAIKGIQGELAEKLIAEMIAGEFLDEERYARSFARGKFRLKKWGRSRIQRELKMRQVPEKLIKLALTEIDPIEYYDSLLNQTEKKWDQTKDSDPFKKKYKVSQYLMSKGFEFDLIKEAIGEICKEN
jgi:regulatory protein